MSIEGRLGRIEQQLDREQGPGPFILILSAEKHTGDPEYEARLRERIADVRRRYPNDQFRLIC